MKDRFESQEKDIEELLGQLKENSVAPSPAASGRIKAAMLEEARRMREHRLPWWRRMGISIPRFGAGKLMSTAAYAAGIMLIILSVLWFTNTETEPALAQLQASQGTVEVEHRVELIADLHYTYKKTVPAGKRIVLSPGDKIVVPNGSIGKLYFANGNKTVIGGDTELLLTSEDESQVALTLKLSKGEIKNYIKQDDKGFSVQTPIATATVSGTVFRVGVGDDDHTFLATDEGSVNVRVDGREIDVKAGQEVEVCKENGLEIVVRPQPPEACLVFPGQSTPCHRVLYSRYRIAEIVARTIPGAKVTIFRGDEAVDYTWADEKGFARYPVVARSEGRYTFRLETTTPDRKSSRLSDAVTFVYDRTPPPLRILAPTSPIVVKSPVKIVGETERGAKAAVNGHPVRVDATGRFTSTLKLEPGENRVNVTVTDLAGNELLDSMVLKMR